MIVLMNSFKFTSKQGNEMQCLNVLNKTRALETYSGNVEVRAESYFLSVQKFGVLDFKPGEIIDVEWERNYKGEAIPKSVRSTGEFDSNIIEFMSY